MNRQSVSSSNIASIGYDEASGTLEIQFNNGTTYQYFDVPERLAREFIDSPPGGSHGKYLNDNIKGNYRYSRV